jgi:hypothetical protein
VIALATAWPISERVPSALPVRNARPPTSITTPSAGENAGSGSAEQETIQLEDSAASARPFQTVEIQGTYRGGANIILRVQRWEEGQWLTLPLPTTTDQSGQFSAYVDFGQPGPYQVRVVDPDSGVASEPSVLLIKG